MAATTRDEPVCAGAEERLEPFAELVAQALENAQARRRLAEAADESRRRLERGLHAGVSQHLLALKLKLPSMYGEKVYVEAGGLMSYGPSIPAMVRRAAFFVDRILKGNGSGHQVLVGETFTARISRS